MFAVNAPATLALSLLFNDTFDGSSAAIPFSVAANRLLFGFLGSFNVGGLIWPGVDDWAVAGLDGDMTAL